ncbi:DUF4326 domain-containing protein [Photobacterium damselae]|uniref:DUF4326 domain-containing protein n=1 Tax=Photobacterium damselae TaxID=38293 RepID=UPI004067710E
MNQLPKSASHIIVIGDEQTYKNRFNLISMVSDKNTLIRKKYVPVTRVINIKRNDCNDYIYIGRGSKWGNPYSHLTGDMNREEAISAFKYDFDRNLFLNVDMKSNIGEIRGKVLGCSCKPLCCHGDVLAKEANNQPFD